MRRPGIKPGSRPWQGRILSLYYRRMLTLSVPRLELGISRVLGERHSQLDHTDGSKKYLEYLGFDPSTSTLLRSHASDCANTPHNKWSIWVSIPVPRACEARTLPIAPMPR